MIAYSREPKKKTRTKMETYCITKCTYSSLNGLMDFILGLRTYGLFIVLVKDSFRCECVGFI